jgi:uncharacterized caspase-like protein
MRSSIISFFTNKTIKPNDVLLFYFSGHALLEGIGDHFLGTSDIKSDEPFVNYKELRQTASKIVDSYFF